METSTDELPGTLSADYVPIYLTLASMMEHRIATHLWIDNPQRLELIKWIAQICNVYRLSLDTLMNVIYLLDHYSSLRRQSVGRLQLLAGTCLYLAAKYHERYHPALSEFVFLSDGLYTFNDFLAMQDEVLSVVQYRLTRNDGRFIARLKVFGKVVAPDFCEAIDFVARASLLAPGLTFSSVGRLGDAIIETIVNTSGSSEGFTEHAIKSQLLEVLEDSPEVFDS
jgi:hypothetical protein